MVIQVKKTRILAYGNNYACIVIELTLIIYVMTLQISNFPDKTQMQLYSKVSFGIAVLIENFT